MNLLINKAQTVAGIDCPSGLLVLGVDPDVADVAVQGGGAQSVDIGGIAVTSTKAPGALLGVGSVQPTDFVLAAGVHQRAAQANARVAYEDIASSRFLEQWASLANWVAPGTPGVQVSANKLYSTGAGGGASGINRSIALGAGETFRAVFDLDITSQAGAGGLIIGISKDAAGAVPASAAANVFGLYLTGANWVIWDGAVGAISGARVTGAAKAFITVDANYISVVVRMNDGSAEYSSSKPRATFGSANNLFLFNSDSRGLTGHAIGTLQTVRNVSSIPGMEGTAAGLMHCSGSADGTSRWRAYFPAGYDSRKPVNVVIAFHGAGSDETHWSTNANGKVVKDALIAAGFVVLAAVGPSTSSWGAQSSLDAYAAAYNWFRSLYPMAAVNVYANSMGGIESLLSLAERRIPGVSAWVGTAPTASLADNYVGNSGGFKGSIDGAYGINGANPYATATAGHDPLLMDGSAFRGVPMLFLAASDDVAVSKANNTDAFAARYSRSNAITVQTGIVGGHSFSFAPYTAQIVAFFKSALLA